MLSALEVLTYDNALYKWTFYLLTYLFGHSLKSMMNAVIYMMFAGARDGKPFTIQLQSYASTDSLPKAYTWSVSTLS